MFPSYQKHKIGRISILCHCQTQREDFAGVYKMAHLLILIFEQQRQQPTRTKHSAVNNRRHKRKHLHHTKIKIHWLFCSRCQLIFILKTIDNANRSPLIQQHLLKSKFHFEKNLL
ncbi:hypothetical protein H5410_008526 [Solanum commersonii]|uniref:Uncharacterized protein n=1 Tax=Solanum commersonii TaxID=4109 RepID=A0A9J6AG87_SOLCO|nr:hypothetical protein H5410_008526 [Solanum commersonii]